MALEAAKVTSKMIIFVFGRGALPPPPRYPYQGSALDPLGASRRPPDPQPFFEYSKLKGSYATANNNLSVTHVCL